MSKFTPGPWVMENSARIYAPGKAGPLLATCAYLPREAPGTTMANARLIAAAPDILDELVQARNTIHSLQSAMTGQFFQEQIDRIDAAIKKATP